MFVIRLALGLFLLTLPWIVLHGQSVSMGFTGATGLIPTAGADVDTGNFEPRVLQQYIAQGGPYVNVELADRFFVRLSAQHTGVNLGVRIDFDPASQPETPITTYSKRRFWFTGPQVELRVGYKIELSDEKKIFIIAGIGRRSSVSSRYRYSSVVGLPSGQGLTLYQEILRVPENRALVYSLGAEYAFPVWRNYAIVIGVEYMYSDFLPSKVAYEFFPARTVSYSSGTYKVSPHQIALRVSVPLLVWKKKRNTGST